MKRFVVSTLFIFFISSHNAQSIEQHEKIGDSLLTAGQYDVAITYFEKELQEFPKNEQILRYLGYNHIAKNNFDQGEKYYTEALSVNPKCGRCYNNIARIYYLKGNTRKALELANKSVNIDPKDASLYASRAKLKEALNNKYGALIDYNKAIEIDPTHPGYFLERGSYYANTGNVTSGLADMTRAIELAPESYNPYFSRANIYYDQQRHKEALKDINKAIELDSTQQSLYTGRGSIYAALQEDQKAIDDYSKAIAINKNYFLPYLNRALSYYQLENLDASCADYNALNSLIEKGNLTDEVIISDIKKSIEDICNPEKPSYYYQRGVAHYNLAEFDKALNIYDEGLAKFPESGMLLSFKGNTLLAIEKYEKAIEFYTYSLEKKESVKDEIAVHPRFEKESKKQTSFYDRFLASTNLSITECLIYLDRMDEALIKINEAIALIPDVVDFNKEFYYNIRGHIYLNMNKNELAIKDFKTSIELNKKFPAAYVNMAIAKMNLSKKVKFSTFTVGSNFKNQPRNVSWSFPNTSSFKKSESNIKAALSDCNTAIAINKNYGFAYYIRGQIKQILQSSDYCMDFLTAQRLGLIVEDNLLKGCIQ
ncbi:tetratricopeptide repeat protein [Aquimarina addita]